MSENTTQRLRTDLDDRFLVLKNARIITVDDANRIIDGDILIEDGRITAIGTFDTSLPRTVDLEGRMVCPGFVQTHVHLCQTLFRGMADDLELLEWLRRKIWPLEAAHNPDSLHLSALIGGMELLASGTTTVLTMETVRHTDAVFEAVRVLGLRAFVGKCMMDDVDQAPAPLRETTADSLQECRELFEKWDGRQNGRIRFALAPRFALACSDRLFRQAGEFAAAHNIPIHSHAAENLREVQAVHRRTGRKNIAYFRDLGLPAGRLYLAHCIWIDEEELDILKDEGMHVLHCPSSNLKLGSGIAMVTEMKERGISVSLGADGAPCNNNLDMLTEMRNAALLQKVRRGPTALSATDALRMATIDGARALGLEADIGSIELGKKADLAIFERDPLHVLPSPDPVSALVYAARASDVHAVMVDGKFVYRQNRFEGANPEEIRKKAAALVPPLLERARAFLNRP